MTMLRGLLERYLTRANGLEYQIDVVITDRELAALVAPRAIALIRGLVRGLGFVFLDRGVIIRCGARVRIGRFSRIGAGSMIEGLCRNGIWIGRGVSMGRYGRIRATATLSKLGSGVRLGNYVGIGDGFYLGAFGGIEIGEETIVGERFTVHSDNHAFDVIDRAIRAQGTIPEPVEIGPRCWIGSNVTVLGGVEVGADSVIGAGSVVTRSFPRGSVIAGNPARLLRNRFDNSEGAVFNQITGNHTDATSY